MGFPVTSLSRNAPRRRWRTYRLHRLHAVPGDRFDAFNRDKRRQTFGPDRHTGATANLVGTALHCGIGMRWRDVPGTDVGQNWRAELRSVVLPRFRRPFGD